ncbi:MAG: hypothetical protein JST10_14920 [Bacteroidetes bacterium]|nr:hypothetical protein [Bacteroidota bacterium]
MEQQSSNINALQFSPYAWWKAIDRGVEMAEIYAKIIAPEFNVRKWLYEEDIEHESLNLAFKDYTFSVTDPLYVKATQNDFYTRVGFVNKYGTKMMFDSLEKLRKNQTYFDGAPMVYQYRVNALVHLATLHFQHWLLFETNYHWLRWQMFYDFIVSKLNRTIGGLFQNMWVTMLYELDFNHQIFSGIPQYKKFRDVLEEAEKASSFILEEYKRKKDEEK